MIPWYQRPREEQTLLNPGFCATLLWHAARSCNGSIRPEPLSFEEAFLIIPIVLHRETRDSLPRNVRTSMAVWLEENALARSRITNRARLLVPFTKEGIIFGGVHGFIQIHEGSLLANETWKRSVKRSLNTTSDEVRECVKKAEFLGRWFAHTGSAPTVLALIGVRP